MSWTHPFKSVFHFWELDPTQLGDIKASSFFQVDNELHVKG